MVKLQTLMLLPAFVLLLTSCGIRDSAPSNYTKQWHEIPDAVPTSVRPSRYGNPDSYSVFGETYYVMDSADSFQQKGRRFLVR